MPILVKLSIFAILSRVSTSQHTKCFYSAMKHLFLCFLSFLTFCMVHAQTTDESQHRKWDDAFLHASSDTLHTDTLSLAGDAAARLSLPCYMPDYTLGAYGLGGIIPYDYANAWRLHEGFNAQFGLSLTAGLGKHAPKGVGFGQTAAFAYVVPINSRLSIAAGLSAANFDWGMWRMTNVGVGGVLAYKVNEVVNLYAYGQKSFLPRATTYGQLSKMPFPVFYSLPSSRIGAAAEFKIGKNAMIGISVERRDY